MDTTYLKNPIVLGLLAAAATYLYLWYKADQEHKQNPSQQKRRISYVTPGLIGVIIWFTTSTYFDYTSNSNTPKASVEGTPKKDVTEYRLAKVGGGETPEKSVNKSESAINSESYHLIGKKMVRLPKTDVFIDLATF